MSHLINKLLGREDDSESHSQSQSHSSKTETHTSAGGGGERNVQRQNSSGGQVSEGRTVQHEGVNIKSTISSDTNSTVSLANQQKLNELVTKLGSTHTQIDEYAKKQTTKINDEIQREIDAVLTRTRTRQDELLKKANEHTAQIDAEYRARLQQVVEEIDATKAKRIAEIEKELNNHQTEILQAARNEIDQLNQKAANLKIGVLQDAQAKAASDATAITAQATNLGQSSTVHQAAGTTTIKTEVSAAATTKDVSGSSTTAHASAGGSTATHGSAGGAKSSESHVTETSRHQSHESKQH